VCPDCGLATLLYKEGCQKCDSYGFSECQSNIAELDFASDPFVLSPSKPVLSQVEGPRLTDLLRVHGSSERNKIQDSFSRWRRHVLSLIREEGS